MNLISASNCIGFTYDGTGSSATGIVYLAGPGGSLQSSVTSGGDGASNKYPQFPLAVWTGSPTYQLRGILVDISGAPSGSGVVQGTEEPGSPAATTTCILGEGWFPNGGTTIVM